MAQIHLALTARQQYWLKHIRACYAAGKHSVEYGREHGKEIYVVAEYLLNSVNIRLSHPRVTGSEPT